MKPMNFPERRNQRRKDALVRLEDALRNARNDTNRRNLERTIQNTKAKIVEGSRYGETSKINRGGRK